MRKPRKSSRDVVEMLPAVAVSVVVGVTYCILSVSEFRTRSAPFPVVHTAGFSSDSDEDKSAFRRLEKRRQGRKSQAERRVRLPDPVALDGQAVEPLYPDDSLREIPNLWYGNEASPVGWEFLSKRVRGEITSPDRVEKWGEIVIHHSLSTGGNAAMFDMYHREVRGVANGLAYHFVVGNGTYSSDGAVEVGRRWHEQSAAGSLPGVEPNAGEIGICLVGDFAAHPPTLNQLKALRELVSFLRARLGHLKVVAHARSGDGLNSCPGRYFPRELVFGELIK